MIGNDIKREIVGTCILCPYMKQIQLDDVLDALKNPTAEQIIEIPSDIAARARRSLDSMFEPETAGRELLSQQGHGALPWTAWPASAFLVGTAARIAASVVSPTF